MAYAFSYAEDVLALVAKYLPQHQSMLSSFSDYPPYNVPQDHPSESVWPRKNNHTNCFALAASFAYKQKGSTIEELQKRLLQSLRGPVRNTTYENEVYKLPLVGITEAIRGMRKPSMDS
eukprot:2988319-Amphidinium_carterae.2